jgi:DNA-binding MarR family transcriptional regulator/ribosomal protein S18 acetylase RimI-like enzyme
VAEDRISAVRAFNRFYTRMLGLLDEGLTRSAYSLTEARVLFEVAQHDRANVADLRSWLGVDAGYLSRILARFESDGLIARERSDSDARRQTARLTTQGRTVFADLDARAADDVQAMLGSVSEPGQRRLLDAMRTIEDLLTDRTGRAKPTLRELRPGDLGWVVQRHGALYAEEYGWDDTFEALVARIVADYVGNRDPKRDSAWIAEVDGAPVGSVFCVHKDARVAQLRLLLVEPSARGMGVGSSLVDACVDFARGAGYSEMVLWTNSVLADARRIYERAGFEFVREAPNPAFGQQLTEQTWRLGL